MPTARLAVALVPLEWCTALLAPAPAGGQDRDGRDFATQGRAQAVLDADPSDPSDPSDPNGVDADADGEACEGLPTGSGAGGDRAGSGNRARDRPRRDAGDLDRKAFPAQEKAQAALDAAGKTARAVFAAAFRLTDTPETDG